MANANILIVEDEAVCALDIQSRLTKSGYNVVGVCTTGEDAVTKAAELKADLVMMDIMLEGRSDGIEAARRIKVTCNIPVIFLTAYSDEATVAMAKLTEPDGYLPKPFDARTLRTTVEIALHRHKMECDRKELVSSVIRELAKGKL
jgi:DNA-binding response OmpR family regulator